MNYDAILNALGSFIWELIPLVSCWRFTTEKSAVGQRQRCAMHAKRNEKLSTSFRIPGRLL